jgi:hypothetical protein
MALMTAAIKAAREVGADTKAPEYYQRATEYFIKARNEYQLRNYSQAKDYAELSRALAEKSEFLALEGGAARTSLSPPEEVKPAHVPYDYPKPTGTPSFIIEENEIQKRNAQPSGSGTGTSPPPL